MSGRYSGLSGRNQLGRGTHRGGKRRPGATRALRVETLEPRHLLAGASYVILTTSAIQTGSTKLSDFVADLTDRGYTVEVKTEADWGGGVGNAAADNLHDWLASNIATLGIQDVLLLGDPNPTGGAVPMKMVNPRERISDGLDKSTPTDYYYAAATANWDLNGDGIPGVWNEDFTSVPPADVRVGRIPVYGSDYTTLDAILTKSIAYERATNEMWRKNILLPMPILNFAAEQYAGQPRTDGAQVGQAIAGDIGAYQFYATEKLYEKAGSDQSTYPADAPLNETNFVQQWSGNPYGFTVWWGTGNDSQLTRKYVDHGTVTSAAAFAAGDTTSLNDSHPSFVVLASPTGGKPENTQNLAYRLLRQGAIGTLAAARQTFYDPGVWSAAGANKGDTGTIAYWFTKEAIENLDITAAEAWRRTLWDHFGVGLGANSLMNAFTFNLYGDPTIIPRQNNHAPVLDNTGDMRLDDMPEDPIVNNGTLVSDLIASAGGQRITDIDRFSPQGIAVTAVYNSVQGTFQFSTNSGSSWSDFGNATDATARLLASDTQTRIRFVPAPGFNGTVVGMTFRAWDQSGAEGNGAVADASNSGGQTPFSAAVQTASVTVWEVNNPPVRTAGAVGNKSFSQNSGITSLGLAGLQYSNGDEPWDLGQSLTYTVTGVPASSVGDVVLSDGVTVVTAFQQYSLSALRGMQFRAAPDAFGGSQQLVYQVADDGTSHGLPDAKTITESIGISVWRVHDTIGQYNKAASVFFLRNSQSIGFSDIAYGFGAPGAGWKPLTGDWNNDGVDTAALYDPATSLFYLRNSHTPGMSDVAFGYGAAGAGWIPLAGDWNHDGTDTVGLYDPATSVFYLRNSLSGGMADVAFGFGAPGLGWLPVAGDWNGDGFDTVGLYIPQTGTYYLRNSNTTGPADVGLGFGAANAGWTPMAGDWDHDGKDTIGAFAPAGAVYFVRNSNTTGMADRAFAFGSTGSGVSPLVGDWNGPDGFPLMAAGASIAEDVGQTPLTVDQATPILAAALARWSEVGLSAPSLHALAATPVVVTDLLGAQVGYAMSNAIYVDRDAAGHGWFIDPTPNDDREFGPTVDAQAADRIDLLTVLAHELGHRAGLSTHVEDGLMESTLAPGVRRLPSAREVEQIFAAWR